MIKTPRHKITLTIEGDTIEEIKETLLSFVKKSFGWNDQKGEHVNGKHRTKYNLKWKKEKEK